jgi:hypothetical protein
VLVFVAALLAGGGYALQRSRVHLYDPVPMSDQSRIEKPMALELRSS